jgi:hypothetical protein
MSHSEKFGFERCYEEEPGGPSIFQSLALPLFACASGLVSIGSNSGVAAGRLGETWIERVVEAERVIKLLTVRNLVLSAHLTWRG